MAKELQGGSIKRWGDDSEDVKALPFDSHKRRYLKGEFIQLKAVSSNYGEGFLLEIDTEKDRETWGCPTRLQMLLGRIRKAGTPIVIFPLTGKRQMSSGKAFDFRVFELDSMHEHPDDLEWDEQLGF